MVATAQAPGGALRTIPTSWWAALSVGAAAIHFAVIPDHLEEWWAFGLFFAVLGWFQAVWPIAYLDRPSRRLALLAIAVNLATVVVWAWSRTSGLPVGPEPGMPEAIGAADLASTAFEITLVVGLLRLQALGDRRSLSDADPSSARGGPIRGLDLAIWVIVAGLSTVAIALGSA
jgi:hypothetical protein